MDDECTFEDMDETVVTVKRVDWMRTYYLCGNTHIKGMIKQLEQNMHIVQKVDLILEELTSSHVECNCYTV